VSAAAKAAAAAAPAAAVAAAAAGKHAQPPLRLRCKWGGGVRLVIGKREELVERKKDYVNKVTPVCVNQGRSLHLVQVPGKSPLSN